MWRSGVSDGPGEIDTTGAGGARPARTRRWIVLGAVAIVAVGVIVLLAVATRDDSEPATTGPSVSAATTVAVPQTTEAPAETTAGPTTAPPTTQAATTAAPVSTTTLAGPPAPGFDPQCVESMGATTGGGPDPATLATFGPLQTSPALTIDLPASIAPDTYVAPGQSDVQSPMVFPLTIPGGVLLPVRASSNGYFPGSMLAVVDVDGSKRWVRCFDEDVVDVLAGSGSEALASFTEPGATIWAPEFRVMSLADGSVADTLAARVAAQGIDAGVADQAITTLASEGSAALLGPDGSAQVDIQRQQLLLVDLDTMQATALAFPELPGVDAVGDVTYGIVAGNPMILRGYLQPTALAVLRGGAWSTDPADLANAFPPTVEFDLGEPTSALRGVDALGQTIWSDDSVVDVRAEGFRTAPSGDVTVVRGCFGGRDPSTSACVQVGIAGVRSADGEVLWRLDGDRPVGAAGDGFALVSDGEAQADGSFAPRGWMMIDTTTGAPVDGQHWGDPTTFEYECCGGGDFVHVSRSGAVVIAVNERRVTVWYPASADLTPQTLSLP
jgi:hypothetical protein